MEYAGLSDNELWQTIARNTAEMSTLIGRQLALDLNIGANESNKKAHRLRSHRETINRMQREYCDCTAELRRRYPLDARAI